MHKLLIFDDVQTLRWSELPTLKKVGLDSHIQDDIEQVLATLSSIEASILVINVDLPELTPKRVSQIIDCALAIGQTEVILLGEHYPAHNSMEFDPGSTMDYLPTTVSPDMMKNRVLAALALHKLKFSLDQKSKSLAELVNQRNAQLTGTMEGVIEYNSSGNIISLNQKAEKILKFKASELTDSRVFDLLEVAVQDGENPYQIKLDLQKKMLAEHAFVNHRSLLKTSRGSTVIVEMACQPIWDCGHQLKGHMLIFQDITARTLNEERLVKLAQYDVVTGLPNRSKFHDFTEARIAQCKKRQEKLALLFIDIDHFKNVNDSMGHDAGDQLLVDVADRLKSHISDNDLLARIGGDEFAITLADIANPDQVRRTVGKIIDLLAQPFDIENRQVNTSVSVGIALYPESGEDIKTLTKAADTSLYQAKFDGRNTYRFFSSEIQNRAMEQSHLEEALRQAIGKDEFCLYYQPQVDATTGKIMGLEALIRWHNEDWPNIGPDHFIPIAEECGLLPALGKWVLYEACRQAMDWRTDTQVLFDFPVSVNLSAKQLDTDFINILEKVLRDTRLPPDGLALELTETAVMQDPDAAIKILTEISNAGVKIALDDFGTRYSSLNYLKNLPIDRLKIDRSFINDIAVDYNGEAILKTILVLAHNLNLQVVAEGVEEQHQVDFLRQHKCDQIQGYFYSRPLPAAETTALLRHEKVNWELLNETPIVQGPHPEGPGKSQLH